MSSVGPVDRRQLVHITQQPGVERQEVVSEDVNSRKRLMLERLSALIGFAFSVLEGAIGLRVLLKLMEANPKNVFANFVYNFTALFLSPFAGLVANPSAGGMILEITSIVAMLVYALIALAAIRLVWLVFYQPSARSVTTYERDQTPSTRLR